MSSIVIASLLAFFSQANLIAAGEVQDLQLGFGQHYTLGHWVPIRFTLATDEPFTGTIELLAPDSDGILVRYPVPPTSQVATSQVATSQVAASQVATSQVATSQVAASQVAASQVAASQVAAGADHLVHVSHYIRIGRLHSSISVRLTEDDRVREIKVPLPTMAYAGTDRMIVSLGADLGLQEVAQEYARGTSNFTHFVYLESGWNLPETWWGYDGIDTLVITTGTNQIKQLKQTQIDAILKWVEQGGKLILSIGRAGDELLAEGQPFANFAPGRFVRVMNQRRTAGLEGAVTATQSLRSEVSVAPIRQSLIAEPDGRQHVYEVGPANAMEPIVIEQVRGFGRLVFVAVDLDRPPLSSWKDRDKLVGKLLLMTLPPGEESQRTGSIGKVLHEGYTDLSGQLRNSMDQYEGVGLIAFSWIVGITIIYLFVVGPGDFLLVNQLLKRPRLTWITLPIFIAIFCGAAYWLDATFKSKQTQLNQIDLVDIDDRSQVVRGTSWHSLYSPTTQSFQLRVSPTAELDEFVDSGDRLLSWQGLPGEGLGGMQGEANTALVSADYQIASAESGSGVVTQINGLPIAISSSRALFTQWTGSRKTGTFGVLQFDDNKRLMGTLINPLPVALKQAVLYHQNRIYRLPETWKTNREIDVKSLRNSARDLESFLTGRAVRFDEQENFKAQWDPTSREMERIMQMVMFYRAAGGLGYTRLSNRYQSQLDCSTMLKNNRAVIVGRVETPATELFDGDHRLSDAAKSWTIFRIVVAIDEHPQPVSE